MSEPHGKIVIKPDEIMKKHGIWAAGEASDASSSSTRREAIKDYTENRGIEPKAFAQVRAGLKMKNTEKRKDWLRSMQLLLPVAEAEIFANEPDLPLEAAPEEQPEAPSEEPQEETSEPDAVEGDAELQAEAEEFEEAAEAADQDDDGVVTPVQFGETAAE